MRIHFGHLGNGMTVYTPDIEDPLTRDYFIIAHISPERVVSYRTKNPLFKHVTKKHREEINHYARTANPSVSITQTEQLVFRTPPPENTQT